MHFVTVDAEEAFSMRDASWRLLPIIISTSSLNDIEQDNILCTIFALSGIRVKGYFDIGSDTRFRLTMLH